MGSAGLAEAQGHPVAFAHRNERSGVESRIGLGARLGRTALWRQGWSLLGDDVAVINAAGVSAEAAPRRVSLRSGSRPLLGEDLWQRISSTPSFMPTAEGCLFHPAEIDGPPAVGQPRLVAVVFLARRGVQIGPAEWRSINPAEALL